MAKRRLGSNRINGPSGWDSSEGEKLQVSARDHMFDGWKPGRSMGWSSRPRLAQAT